MTRRQARLVAVFALVLVLCGYPVTAWACTSTPPVGATCPIGSGGGPSGSRPTGGVDAIAVREPDATSTGRLPNTGADVNQLVLLAFVVLGLGTALTVSARIFR